MKNQELTEQRIVLIRYPVYSIIHLAFRVSINFSLSFKKKKKHASHTKLYEKHNIILKIVIKLKRHDRREWREKKHPQVKSFPSFCMAHFFLPPLSFSAK